MKIEIANRDEWVRRAKLIIEDIEKIRKERIADWEASLHEDSWSDSSLVK
jgi:hypothetical protein